jgi:hypothetical protein
MIGAAVPLTSSTEQSRPSALEPGPGELTDAARATRSHAPGDLRASARGIRGVLAVAGPLAKVSTSGARGSSLEPVRLRNHLVREAPG